ncbi:hypothetical protein F5888DRAFT_1633904 [Russula emetica]|nr:hypothetical protein F5888DRAFT_1633904 [Russula emetica]
MLHEFAASSRQAQTPSDSKSNRLCPVCGDGLKRDQELNRHILDLHLPDWICCPHPACNWHGSRKTELFKHIKVSGECGANPKWVEQYKIYDTELILRRLISGSAPLETVETFALGLIEERARELEKVDAWGPLTEWRRPTTQVLVEMS